MIVSHLVAVDMNRDSFTDEIADKASKEIKTLTKIEGVVSAQFGKNFGPDGRSGGFNYCVVIILRSREFLPTYLADPIHVAWVKEFILPYKENIVAMDLDNTRFVAANPVNHTMLFAMDNPVPHEASEAVRSLLAVEGVRRVQFGATVSQLQNKNFTHMLAVEIQNDTTGVQALIDHPSFKAFENAYLTSAKDTLVLDVASLAYHCTNQVSKVVLLELKDEFELSKADTLISKLTTINGVVSVHLGPTFTTDRSQNFNYAAHVVLEDRGFLPQYVSHPLHHQFVTEFVRPNRKTMVELDIDTETYCA